MFEPSPVDAQLPRGVADFLPDMADKIGFIQKKISEVFEQWGFRRIITPLLEFEDVLALGIGDDLRTRTFRFDDRQSGRLLAIPSDITPQVARIVATRMRLQPLPHRLCYQGRVLRHAELQSGRSREIFQSGVELIGLDSPEADAEMVAMAVAVLQSLGFTDFKVDIGHVGFFRGVLAAAGLDAAVERRLRTAIAKKDASAVRDLLKGASVSESARTAIMALPRLFGGREVLDAAEQVAIHDQCHQALETITQVMAILDAYGVADYVTIDLGEIRGLDYHSGLTFEGFVTGVGEPVCGGGRYDTLMGNYGFNAPATGFACNILPLLAALEHRPELEASTSRDFLLFNAADDRGEVLRIARCLRGMGYSAARDIIKRDFASSLAYARQTGIRRMLVIGGDACAPDEVYIVRAADGSGSVLKKEELFGATGRFDFDRL